MSMQNLRPAVAAFLALAIAVPCAITGAAAAPPPGGSKGAGTDAPADPPADGENAGGKAGAKKRKPSNKNPLAPISKEDRLALNKNLEFLIPAPTKDLVWVGGGPMTVESFKGQVTVIQSFGGKQSMRSTLDRAKRVIPEGVTLIGLHTPEGAEDAPKQGATSLPCPIAVDPSGAWCDELGVWTTPVNIVVNKAGAVVAVALSDDGLRQTLPTLLEEDASEFGDAPERPRNEAMPAEALPAGLEEVDWPTFDSKVGAAADRRGQPMPAFKVAKWLSAQPDPANRLIAMDFWATWCPPCRAAIPHLNVLQGKFGTDVLFVGISNEEEKDFNAGLKKFKLSDSSFKYSVALDPGESMMKFFGVTGIPHLAIASPDGIVRWQGMPGDLKDEDLRKLVEANRKANPDVAKPRTGTPSTARSWANRPPQKSR